MIEPEHLLTVSREDLLSLVAELQRQSAALTASHEALRAELDPLTRGGKRQAAPKPPGRKPGAGTFRYRAIPPPETITAPVDVRVLLEACLVCGGPLVEERVDFA
jgi:transposase